MIFLFRLEQILQFTLLSNSVSKRHCLWILLTDIPWVSFDLGNVFPWRWYGTENSFWEKACSYLSHCLLAHPVSLFLFVGLFLCYSAPKGSKLQEVAILNESKYVVLSKTHTPKSLSLSFLTWSWIDTVTASVWSAPPPGSYFGCLLIFPDDGALLGWYGNLLQ